MDVTSPDDYKSLAKALDITGKKLRALLAAGELLDDDERKEAVLRWLDSTPQVHSIIDEEDIEDLEIHGE